MAKECFEDGDIISLLNRYFINIKLDRDERPDIDRLYQHAVAQMGAGGGWPLSVFLTPERKPFFGGTYFPPEDMHGRPGFKKVLMAVSEFYKTKKDEISRYTEAILKSLKPEPQGTASINESLVVNAVKNILKEFDPQNGGFGTAPKFPMTGTIEFLLNRYILKPDEPVGYALRKTLLSMANGGMYDHIGGGFHRYSTDEMWLIPHFEKMAEDNAWLLRNYIGAYTVFNEERFLEVAKGIIRFTKDVFSDPEGGFYTSQDADVTPDDEGGYFTWTDDDLRRILNDDEYQISSLHFMNESGSMHHDESKKVLFISTEPKEVAEKLGMKPEDVLRLIERSRDKLFRARNKRKSPFVDKTLYTSFNGMYITAYLTAFRVLGDKELKDFALMSIDRVMKKYFLDGELFHSEGVKGLLDDYVYLTEALISAYEITGKDFYLKRADDMMRLCLERFWDSEGGGFFYNSTHILGIKMKGIEDISHPSANSLGIMLLLKLYHLTSRDIFKRYAEKALKTFASNADKNGIIAGYYFASLDAYFNMFRFSVYTDETTLKDIVCTFLSPYVSIVHGEDRGCVVPCYRGVCFEPISTPDELKDFMSGKKYLGNVAGAV
jgi:uncharacterized protein YyaL (SSP411 family)